MNQILENLKIKKNSKRIYNIQFSIFLIFICMFVFYISVRHINQKNDQKVSQLTTKSYSILRLYLNNQESFFNSHSNISKAIVGTIKIPKINIEYPILSTYSEALLKISVCKFYGPDINSIGNFCILGHNYDNDVFFSKTLLLKIGDIINIYDLNNNVVNYTIYNIYEVLPDNLSYLTQDTSRGKRNNAHYL